MTTYFDDELPVLPQVALSDIQWYATHEPTTELDIKELLNAARSLSVVVKRVQALKAGAIGADDYLSQFDGGDCDTESFYRGVAFALARVNKTLAAWKVGNE